VSAPGRVYVGTSGWAYKAWAETFYPAGLPAKKQLAYYASRFSTVEINASFYRLPTPEAVAAWRAQAPLGFIYAVKGSRTVTHYFKLLPGSKSLPLLLERVAALGPHLGPLLWQLPPGWGKNAERLDAFLGALPRHIRHAVEFRDTSWLCDEVFGVLRRHRAAHVSVSAGWFPRDRTVTADFAYVRFHGLAGGAAHDYTRAELAPWAEHLRACARAGIDAYAYFNNDVSTRAPANAELLARMVRNPASGRARPSRGRGAVARP
jgi:uncharacterized protein YecE (DUF72 family)